MRITSHAGVADAARAAADAGVADAARAAADAVGRVPAWLESDPDSLAGRVLRGPARAETDVPVAEQLVIERYSRR